MTTTYRCACGGVYTRVPDEEAEGQPPSFLARYFHCATCDTYEWLEPFELNLEEWPENEP